MALNLRNPNAIAADSSLGMNMLASTDSFSPSFSPSLSPTYGASVTDSEKGPFCHATEQAIEMTAPAGHNAPQQAEQPGPSEPVTLDVIQDHSVDAGMGNHQVLYATDADEQRFMLTNPFHLPPIAGTENQGRNAGRRWTTNLFAKIKRKFMPGAERWTALGYLNLFFFHLPAFYFTRVAKVFKAAQLTLAEVERGRKKRMEATELSCKLRTFMELWEELVDSLMREWKVLNLVAALLMSAIVSLMQLQTVNEDPLSNNALFLSLIGALLCLLYGCMYVIRFGSLKSMQEGLSWVYDAQHSQSKWRSMWVLLALPALFFGISLFWFILAIIELMSALDPISDPSQNQGLSHEAAFGWRFLIMLHLTPGLAYFVLMIIMLWSQDALEVNVTERGENGDLV
ncbi:hypothetical protein APHAL10511_003228 [Amanita phalloides]|nr:hypothetical protein APHAL10511_003228 [Amanita phalloides]